jgi:hypothetical protein
MPPHPRELDSEIEITYWRDRVSSLEVLVGEMIGVSVRDRMCSINSLGREASAALAKIWAFPPDHALLRNVRFCADRLPYAILPLDGQFDLVAASAEE